MCTDKSFIINTAAFHKKIRILNFDFMVTSQNYCNHCFVFSLFPFIFFLFLVTLLCLFPTFFGKRYTMCAAHQLFEVRGSGRLRIFRMESLSAPHPPLWGHDEQVPHVACL